MTVPRSPVQIMEAIDKDQRRELEKYLRSVILAFFFNTNDKQTGIL